MIFEPKTKIDSGNAEFLKSLLSPRREHRKWGPEGPHMEPRTPPEHSVKRSGTKKSAKAIKMRTGRGQEARS